MSSYSNIAECLLAHALLCRQIAKVSWCSEVAYELDGLAEECVRTAAIVVRADAAVRKQHCIEYFGLQPSLANT